MRQLTDKERKEAGLPYHYDTLGMMEGQYEYQELLYDFNLTRPTEPEKKQALMKKMFAKVGENCHIETPIHANWGGHHVHLGNGIYCNSGVTFVDDADIYIGDYCLIAPNVVFSTSGHPTLPILRMNHYVYNIPITVGKNVWIGSGAQIMPGVHIGDNSVIGAGSVVTGDIPANVVAHGVPCRVIREISEKDQEFFWRNRKLDVWE